MLGGIVVILLSYPSASGSLVLRTGAWLCGERAGGPFPENRHWRTDGGQGISEARAERQGRAHASPDTEGI